MTGQRVLPLRIPGDSAPPIPATLISLSVAGPAAWESFEWPARFSDIALPLAGIYERYVKATAQISDPDTRAILLLGRPIMALLPLVQFAIWTASAEAKGRRLTGDHAVEYLAGRVMGGYAFEKPNTAVVHVPFSRRFWPRRLARTMSWTAPGGVAKAMLRPDGLALTHNALLRSYLRSSEKSVRNAYDSDFDLANEEADTSFIRRNDSDELAAHMAQELLQNIALPHLIRQRLRVALQVILRAYYAESVQALSRVRNSKNLPKNLYTGTGSKWMSRLLGIEVVRRGGQVVRCDHGGSLVLLDTPDATALNEMAVSTQFIVATNAAAASSNFQEAGRRLSGISNCAVVGHHGDSSLDVGAPAFIRNPSGRKRRAMYVPTVYYGMRQVYPPTVPEPLYLDWQRRLLSELKKMSIDVVLKPHPEGLRPPPDMELSGLVTVDSRRFEEAVSDADVLIYDFPATTTLAIGLCTDRPIVLIDHGTMRFSHSIRPMLEKRCRLVTAGSDDRNRIIICPKALEDAVCGGPDEADPGYFRSLFLNEPTTS